MREKIYAALVVFISLNANADIPISSGVTDILQNPFVVIGRDENDKSISGYVAALHVSPQRTDECKFLFKGKLKNNKVDNLVITGATNIHTDKSNSNSYSHGSLRKSGDTITIFLDKKDAPDDCKWILSFLGEPAVKEFSERFEISFSLDEIGKWRDVTIVQNDRAYFHDYPNAESKRKAFVVRRDVVYVYGQDEDWLNVKYRRGKHETNGWIKKSDTLQIPKQP